MKLNIPGMTKDQALKYCLLIFEDLKLQGWLENRGEIQTIDYLDQTIREEE